jgi:hypothetical protein
VRSGPRSASSSRIAAPTASSRGSLKRPR